MDVTPSGPTEVAPRVAGLEVMAGGGPSIGGGWAEALMAPRATAAAADARFIAGVDSSYRMVGKG